MNEQNEKKISFIVMISEIEKKDYIVQCLNELIIPNGYEVDFIPVEYRDNIADAYNEGMSYSEAKYKIYLDENAKIINRGILTNILDIFHRNPNVGAIGVLGNMVIPTNGICVTGIKRIGRVVDYSGNEIVKGEFYHEYEKVAAVDGIFMATQVDIPWRSDLFVSTGFYDTAQCVEYKRHGYDVVIPQMNESWLMFNWQNSNKNYTRDAQNNFQDEYAKDIYPLVSMVVPTYCRPKFFRKCLDSIIAQTYRNIDIFITDNSPDRETADFMMNYEKKDARIKYEHHPEFTTAGENINRAIEYNNEKAEYVNIVMDDDILEPTKIEKMVNAYLEYDNIALVTSYRKCIDENDNDIPDRPWTEPIVDKNVIIDGEIAGKECLTKLANYIGEPTTTLVKKDNLRDGGFGFTGDEGEDRIMDFTTWLYCLTKGDLFYFREPLSRLRVHKGQESAGQESKLRCTICWGICMDYAYRHKWFLKTFDDYKCALEEWLSQFSIRIHEMNEEQYNEEAALRLRYWNNRLLNNISRQ